MDAEALCTCGCPYRRHRPEISRGAVVLACFRHDSCEGFTPERAEVEAGPPAQLLVGEPLDLTPSPAHGPTPLLVDDHTGDVYWPTDPAAPSTLRRSWSSFVCERCEGMAWTWEPVCHGRRMTPVRLEMHSREPL